MSRTKDVPCEVCGKTVTIYGRQKQHCDTEECGVGYARKLAFERVERVGECDVWTGETHKKGGAAIVRLNLSGTRRDLRALALRDPDAEKAKYRVYINTCGTPNCVTVEHHYVQIGRKGEPPSQRILARLPVDPMNEYIEKTETVIGAFNHKPLQQARKKGYFTVSGADAFCIDILGIHPVQIWGDLFFTAGVEDAAA